jgi:hypothetical protein
VGPGWPRASEHERASPDPGVTDTFCQTPGGDV